MKEYVLVSQGIEIYRTKDKDEAEMIVKTNNDNLEKLEEKEITNGKECNLSYAKIFLEEEDISEHEFHIRDIIISAFADNMKSECWECDTLSENEKENFVKIIDATKKHLENKYLNN